MAKAGRAFLIAAGALALALAQLAGSGGAAAEPLDVALSAPGWPPGYFASGDARNGLFLDILDEAAAKSGVVVRRTYIEPARAGPLFRKGVIEIELAKNPSWRSAAEDVAVSLWTVPYSRYAVVVIAHEEERGDVDQPEILNNRPVGITRGYDYPYLAKYRFEAVLHDDDQALVKAVADGSLPFGVVGELLASYWRHAYAARYRMGAILDNVSLHMRFHKDRRTEFKAVDQALTAMLESGRIKALHQKWLGRDIAPGS